MKLTQAEKERLESAGIQCIRVSEDSPTAQALEENIQKFIEQAMDSLFPRRVYHRA